MAAAMFVVSIQSSFQNCYHMVLCCHCCVTLTKSKCGATTGMGLHLHLQLYNSGKK